MAHRAWPTKTIKVVVPLTPGSATDVMARIVFDQVSQQVGQPIVIENRPGAGNSIGMNAVAKADPDGYTILANSSSHTVSPAVRATMPLDTANDLAAIIPLGNMPVVILFNPKQGLQEAQRLRRLGQGQSRQGELFVGRRRQFVPPQRRAVPARRRLRCGAPAVQGRAGGDDRGHRRTLRLLFLAAGQRAAADEGRPVAGARGEQLRARLGTAGRPDRRRGRLSELGIQFLGRRVRAGEDPAAIKEKLYAEIEKALAGAGRRATS